MGWDGGAQHGACTAGALSDHECFPRMTMWVAVSWDPTCGLVPCSRPPGTATLLLSVSCFMASKPCSGVPCLQLLAPHPGPLGSGHLLGSPARSQRNLLPPGGRAGLFLSPLLSLHSPPALPAPAHTLSALSGLLSHGGAPIPPMWGRAVKGGAQPHNEGESEIGVRAEKAGQDRCTGKSPGGDTGARG